MNLLVILIAWIVLSPLWAYLIGRALRTPTPPVKGRPAPAWARQTRRRR